MKLFPESRRSVGLAELLSVWIVLACGLPFLSGLLSGAGWPRLSEVVFGVAALLLLAAVVCVSALVVFGRLRFESALAASLPVLLVAGAASLLLDLSGWWNDGSAYLVLRPGEAVSSILMLGLAPLRSGPTALLRFWPVFVALGVAWRLRPFKVPPLRIVLASGVSYLVLAFSVHALSWIAGALSIVRKMSIESASDIFRLLVSAQSGGYWTANQGERLFAPLGRQAETGLAAAQSASWFLSASVILLVGVLLWPPARRLAKRLLSLESLPSLFVAIAGLGVGTAIGAVDHSYTYGLSLSLFVVSVVAWVWRERLKQDLENLPEDELRRPHLPLPSGSVAPHELESLNSVLAAMAFFGAALLGWTVFVGFLFAECVSWLRSRRGLAWGSVAVSDAVALLLSALALGFAGLAFGLRGFTFMPWQAAAVSAAAVLVVGIASARRLEGASKSRAVRVLLPTGLLLLALALLRQPAVWGFGFLAALAQTIIGWRDDWSARYGHLPGLLLLMTVAVLALAWPVLWRSF